jgi:hypothetical protein
MEKNHGDTCRIAAFFNIEAMYAPLQLPCLIRFDVRI